MVADRWTVVFWAVAAVLFCTFVLIVREPGRPLRVADLLICAAMAHAWPLSAPAIVAIAIGHSIRRRAAARRSA